MKHARPRIRFRLIRRKGRQCALRGCTRPAEDTFMGLPVCWLHRLTCVARQRLR